MKRSFFSVAVLGFVLAFLYVPIVLVVVYAFVPDGQKMSFTGEGLAQYADEAASAAAETSSPEFQAEWKAYRKSGDEPTAREREWLAMAPRGQDGKLAAFDSGVSVGDIRLTRFGKRGHPFAFLVTRSNFFGWTIVPVSPLSAPSGERELSAGGLTYQLWNAVDATGGYVEETWRIGRVGPETVARVDSGCAALARGVILQGKGPVARYEKHFFASWVKRFLGFSGKWYGKIFSGDEKVRGELGDLMHSFWLSLIVAGLATVASCVLGTTAALALHKWRGRLQSVHHALVYTPLVMPDILIGISLLMLFVACRVDCGFWTIFIAHVTFCVSYVVMTLLARLADFDDRIVEAAYDLGAGPIYTFFHVELPILMPGIVAGGLLAFTLSIDDVVITSFVNGAGTNTFPTYVSSMTKHSKNLPAAFALSTLMLAFTCVLAGMSKLISGKQPTQKGK